MILWLLAACSQAPEDWQPARWVPPVVSVPEHAGRCDWNEGGRVDLGEDLARGIAGGVPWTATTTSVRHGGVELWLPGEIRAQDSTGEALWLALGTGGVARVAPDHTVQHWLTGGRITGIALDQGQVLATDLRGRLWSLPEPPGSAEPVVRLATRPSQDAPAPVPIRIEALLADGDGLIAGRTSGAGGEWIELGPSLEIRARGQTADPIRDLTRASDGVLLAASTGVLALIEPPSVLALPGEEIRSLALHGDQLAVATLTRGLLLLDRDGRELQAWPIPETTPPVAVGWLGNSPWAATTFHGRLTDGAHTLGLPGPAGVRTRGIEDTGTLTEVDGHLVVALPTYGLAELFEGDRVVGHPVDGAVFDMVPHPEGWIVALGTDGVGLYDPVSRSLSRRCDLPGVTRRVAVLQDGTIVAAADSALFALKR